MKLFCFENINVDEDGFLAQLRCLSDNFEVVGLNLTGNERFNDPPVGYLLIEDCMKVLPFVLCIRCYVQDCIWQPHTI